MPGKTIFTIGIELGALIPPAAPLNKESFPNLAHAVATITAAVHARWSAFAAGTPMPNGKVIANRTGEYLRSIQMRAVGDFAGEVFSVLPYAASIETGSPARDMKLMLNSSMKVRVSKKTGARYLIIPFRHNNPNSVLGHAMPAQVFAWWHRAGVENSHVTGTYRRLSGTGAFDIKTRQAITVPGWRYKYGDRLGAGDLAALGVTGKPAKRMTGMLNFRAPGTAGGASQSKYLTFRTMVAGGKGWVAPARPGLFPARTTADEIRPVAQEAFAAAAAKDINSLLGGG